jgi:signal peptidase I
MNITFDFMFFLTLTVIITGIISLIDILFFAKKRVANNSKQPIIIEYSRSFFPVLLLVLLIRAFLIQPYRVPSGSLEPTVLPGDFIVVNQFAYGLHLPVINTRFIKINEPKVGEIALFRWPSNPHIVFVKRVIGVPGDHISYKNKILTVNGKVASQLDIGMDLDQDPALAASPTVELKIENLPTLAHKIFIRKGVNENGDFDIVVPSNSYFMMGDNRDGSDDSRDWGFVPEENLIGKAFGIWMSWNVETNSIRWDRIGKSIY